VREEEEDGEYLEIARSSLAELDTDASGTVSSAEFLAYGRPFERLKDDSSKEIHIESPYDIYIQV
jgi:hypothetical protein